MTWRWPWVSRELYDTCQGVANRLLQERDAARAELERERNGHSAELAAERERYERLVAQMIELKRLDYGPVPVIPVPQREPVPPIPVEVMKNIALISEPNTPERRRMENRVRDLLGGGVAPEDVAKMVLEGEEVPDV